MSSFNRYRKSGEASGDDEGTPGKNFLDRWQTGSSHLQERKTIDASIASQEILAALRLRRGSETASWLSSLSQELSDVGGGVAGPNDPPTQSAMTDWLERMFDQFQSYADEFNQTAEGTDLIVNCAPPTYRYQLASDRSQSGDSTSGKITTLEGHLSTRYWAMLIRGRYEKIEIFVLPVETLLGFSASRLGEKDFPPLMEINAVWKDNQLSWQLCWQTLSYDNLQDLTRELFGDLVRVAGGTMSNAELFAHHSCKLSLGESLAVGFVRGDGKQAAGNPNQKVCELPKSRGVFKRPSDLTILDSCHRLLAAIDMNIDQLLQEGKQALECEDMRRFDELKQLTSKLDSLKVSINRHLLDLQALKDK